MEKFPRRGKVVSGQRGKGQSRLKEVGTGGQRSSGLAATPVICIPAAWLRAGPPDPFQGGRLREGAGSQLARRGGRKALGKRAGARETPSPAYYISQSPVRPRGPQPWREVQTCCMGLGVRVRVPIQWTRVGRSSAIGSRTC